MSEGLDTWREKRDYFQQQEAITVDPDQKFALHKKIEEAKTKIAELEAVAARSSPVSSGHFQHDFSRILKYAPAELIGREAETQLIDAAWAKVQSGESNHPRVLTFVALGGEGKTSLVAHWTADLSAQGWPGCDAAFAWSFYSQGTREQSAASSDIFLKEALTFFGDDEDQAFAASNAGAFEKGQRLARIVGERKSLLILDGLEPLQYAPTSPTPGELKDQGLVALLRGLAQHNRGLCLVTTRYSLPDLKAFWKTTAPEKELKRLTTAGGIALLKSYQVGPEDKPVKIRGTPSEFEQLVEDLKGHALSLSLMGSYLLRFHAGDIRKRDLVKLEQAGRDHHVFHIMDAYVRSLAPSGWRAGWRRLFDVNERRAYTEGRRALAVLRLMGLFDRPADAACLAALRREPIPGLTEALDGLADDDWAFCLSGLETARLLTVNRDATGALLALDAHPHLRAYFAQQLRETNAAAWRAAHRRLYEHLCASTSDQKDAPTLEDLQPLYQAVVHGCLAGMQQEACENVYAARIARGGEAYAVKKLGAFGSDLGAVACFFEEPWRRVSPALSEPYQAWLLNEAAFRLRALGRLTEALEPMRIGLELTLGEMAAAVAGAAQSVTHADRSGDAFQQMSKRTTHADALHQAGRWAEAAALFREAERMQAERQPDYPLLYSLGSFRYCDLLLADAERAAWRTVLPAPAGRKVGGEDLVEICRAVSQRAARTLKIAEHNRWLLDIALDHLSLGRAALYEAVLTAADVRRAQPDIEQAVAGLRRAGTQDHFPRALLTRAWLRFLLGACSGSDSAQADLDEAWAIAERGPMRLFLADIHLHRARLFHAATPYPWDSPRADLAAARKLIEQCGYGRRLEELADAEAALGCARI